MSRAPTRNHRLAPPPGPRQHRARRTLARPAMLAAFAAGVLTITGLGPAPAAAQPSTTGPGIHTVRTTAGHYAVYVAGSKRADVAVSDPAYSVRTTVGPKADWAALITDFDGQTGAGLVLLDVSSGRTRTVAEGKISSAVFRPDGQLGYVHAGELHTLAPGRSDAEVVARLDGRNPQLLGWSRDGGSAFVQHRDGGQGPTLVRVDLATGRSTPLLSSDAGKGVVYRDFRVVDLSGSTRISAIRADHIYPCAGTSSSLILADTDGRVLRTIGTTSDAYRAAVWSPDGGRVAYALQACVSMAEKAADRGAALQRLESLNGLYVRDLANDKVHRVMRGIPQNFQLGEFDQSLRLVSDRYGVRQLDATGIDVATAEQLDAVAAVPDSTTAAAVSKSVSGPAPAANGSGDVSIQAKVMASNFIHQLWDTANNFNGNSACGPTSSVMDIAGYQLPNQNGYWVDYPSRHWSGWGGYITHTYTAYGSTFNAYAPDPNWNYFAGAYGWMVDDPNVGSIHYWLRDYLDRHVSYYIAETGSLSPSWIRSKIDANLMVVVSGNFAYGRYGHIALITGYTDDGRFYVNDPYGAGTDGSWDGKNTVYTLDYMRGWYAWAA